MKKGFTLIELLVVIAIIAILAAILFPVFAQARSKARQASCLSNTRQIALAMLMYADDYDETLPDSFINPWNDPASSTFVPYPVVQNTGGTGYDAMMWGFGPAVMDYVKNSRTFHCPEDKQGSNGYSYAAPSLWTTAPGQSATQSKGFNSSDITSSAMARIDQPADTIIVACAPFNPLVNPDGYRRAFVNNNFTQIAAGGYDWISPGNVFNTSLNFDWSFGSIVTVEPEGYIAATYGADHLQPWFRLAHNGGTNFGFADGHAKWSKISATVAPVNQWTVTGTD